MSRVDAVGLAAQVGAGKGGMGTKKTAMEFFVPVESAQPAPNMAEMSADETIGSRFPIDREVGAVFYEPALTGKVRGTNLPRLLSSYMGDPVTTMVSTGIYNHVFDPVLPAAVPRALSLLLHRADPSPPITDLFWDCLGNDLTLSLATNDWLSFEAAFVARSLDDTQAAPTVVQDLTKRYSFYKTTCFISIPSVAGGVEAPVSLSGFNAAWTGNIDTDAIQLGSRDLYKIAPGNVDCEVTFTPLQDLAAYYRRAFLTTPEAVKLRILAQGPLISGSDYHEVEITLHRLLETAAAADIDASSSLNGVELTSQAALDPATGKFYTVRVKNAVASYVPA